MWESSLRWPISLELSSQISSSYLLNFISHYFRIKVMLPYSVVLRRFTSPSLIHNKKYVLQAVRFRWLPYPQIIRHAGVLIQLSLPWFRWLPRPIILTRARLLTPDVAVLRHLVAVNTWHLTYVCHVVWGGFGGTPQRLDRDAKVQIVILSLK